MSLCAILVQNILITLTKVLIQSRAVEASMALRINILGLQAGAHVKKKVNSSGQDGGRFTVPQTSPVFGLNGIYIYVWNLQIANQQELHIHAHLSSHLIRITLSVPMPKAAAPFLREK